MMTRLPYLAAKLAAATPWAPEHLDEFSRSIAGAQPGNRDYHSRVTGAAVALQDKLQGEMSPDQLDRLREELTPRIKAEALRGHPPGMGVGGRVSTKIEDALDAINGLQPDFT